MLIAQEEGDRPDRRTLSPSACFLCEKKTREIRYIYSILVYTVPVPGKGIVVRCQIKSAAEVQ